MLNSLFLFANTYFVCLKISLLLLSGNFAWYRIVGRWLLSASPFLEVPFFFFSVKSNQQTIFLSGWLYDLFSCLWLSAAFPYVSLGVGLFHSFWTILVRFLIWDSFFANSHGKFWAIIYWNTPFPSVSLIFWNLGLTLFPNLFIFPMLAL